MDNTLLIALLGGIVTILASAAAATPGILALRQQRRKLQAESKKTEADAAEVIQKMTLELIEPYRKRIIELEDTVTRKNIELLERIEKLEDELLEVAECAHALYNQIKEQGGEPICEPPDKDKIAERLGRSTTKRKRVSKNGRINQTTE